MDELYVERPIHAFVSYGAGHDNIATKLASLGVSADIIYQPQLHPLANEVSQAIKLGGLAIDHIH